MRLFLLGEFRIERAGEPVPPAAWQGRAKARTLLKLLALAPGHHLHREQVLELLWPDVEPAAALNHLGKALHAARRALQPNLASRQASSYLRVDGDLLSLDPSQVWIDVDHFERAAAANSDAAALEAAISAYGGELLPGDRYEEWTFSRREELAARFRQVLFELAGVLERREDVEAAITRLRQVLAEDPAHEEAHRALIRLYMRRGSRHQAIRQYQTCRTALREELGAAPEAATEALYREIQAARMETAREGAARAPAPQTLPPLLRQPFAVPLVGRERALSLLLEGLEGARVGRGGLVLVGGELGVGKTRLLGELAQAAHGQGAEVLWGASYAQEGVVAYGPLIEALEGYLARSVLDQQGRFAADYPELSRLLSTFSSTGIMAPETNPAAERARLYAALVQLLDDLGASRPVVMVLDDLHAADEASLQVLHHLARAAPDRHWLLVGAFREEDVSPESPLGLMRAALTRGGMCLRLDLRRLARADSDQLARALLPGAPMEPALLEQFYHLTLGNPLFLQEMVRSLSEQGALSGEMGAWPDHVDVPWSLQELVQARARGLGESTYRTLSLAAVAGMTCSFAELRAAGDLPEEPLLDALDRALAARILAEEQDGYAFRHPLFRAALYEHISRGRRAWLHGRLARALEERHPGAVEALAYHYGRSTEADKALPYLERAGDHARSVYANDVAAGYYRDLVERLEKAGRGRDAAAAREKLGAVLTTTGCFAEALGVLGPVAAMYREEGDPDGLGRVAAQIGRLHGNSGRTREGADYLQGVLVEVGARASQGTLATLYSTLAMTCFAGGRYTETLAAAEQAATSAHASGNQEALVESEGRRGQALFGLARFEEARTALDAVIPLAEAAGDLVTLPSLLSTLGAIYLRRGEFSRHAACLERALALARQQGDPFGSAFFLSILGSNHFYQGDWPAAHARLKEAEALGRSHLSWVTPYPLLGQGELLLAMGNWETAARYLEESSRLAESYNDLQCVREAGVLLAEREVLIGQPEPARVRLEALLDASARVRADVTAILIPLALAHLALGDQDQARQRAAQGVRSARNSGNRFLLTRALRSRAMVLISRGRWSEAARALEEGLGLARSMPYPYAEARLLHAYGLLETRRGNARPARQRLEAALALFERLGACKHHAQARADLAMLPCDVAADQAPAPTRRRS